MNLVYVSDLVQSKIDQIDQDQPQTSHVGYKKAFCDKRYYNSSYIGCWISLFQALTGIDVLMFYSNSIFHDTNFFSTE